LARTFFGTHFPGTGDKKPMLSDLSPVRTGPAFDNVPGKSYCAVFCYGLRFRAILYCSRDSILSRLYCFVKGFSKFNVEFVFALIVRHFVSGQRGKILLPASSFVKGF